MSYLDTHIGTETHRAPSVAAWSAAAEERSTHEHSRKIFESHLSQILNQLAQPETATDGSRARETLLALSADIRSGSSVFQGSDYRWLLDRLTQIYAQGFQQRAPEPFTTTAAAYGQVIQTISHEYPSHDYSEAVGQLFCYMSRLFRTQESSWKEIYEHIRSIPDSVEAKQLLNRAFFVEIQEWAEAGVENLFSIRTALLSKIAGIEARIEEVDQRIAEVARKSKRPRRKGTTASTPNVIDLVQARTKRTIELLERTRQELVEEKESEESVVALIQSDIRAFEEKLRNTRRLYFIRPV